MDKNKTLKLEILIAGLFLIFASLIIFGERLHKEEEIEEVIIESEPEIDYTKIENISGQYRYEDDAFLGIFGIDVSEFQEEIDWKKVKEAGVEFVFIRIGRRGATTGMLYDDQRFEENYKGATENDIPVGIYFFSQATTQEEAIEEAKWVKDHLKGRKLDLPIVYDLEEVFFEDEKSRTQDLEKQQLTDNTLAFLKEFENTSYETMIYTYLDWEENKIEMDRLSDYPIWFAQYDIEMPHADHPISIWQYSNKGTVNGIKEPVDMNIMFIRKNDRPE